MEARRTTWERFLPAHPYYLPDYPPLKKDWADTAGPVGSHRSMSERRELVVTSLPRQAGKEDGNDGRHAGPKVR